MEIDSDSEDPETQPSSEAAAISGVTEPTTKTTESNNNVAMNHTKVPQSANGSPTVSRIDEHVLSKSKDGIAQSIAVKPLKTGTATNILQTSQTFTSSSDPAASAKLIAAKPTTDKTITAATLSKCKDTTVKCTAVTSTSATAESKYSTAATKVCKTNHKSTLTTAAAPIRNCSTRIAKWIESTNACTTAFSSTNEAKSTCTKIPSKSTAAPFSVTAAKPDSSPTTTSAISNGTTSSTKRREATRSTVSPQTIATGAAAKKTKTHMDVAPCVPVSNPPAMTTAMFDVSEHKNPPAEPSQSSLTRARANSRSSTVGKYYNHLSEKMHY